MISTTFKAILKDLGHLQCNFGLARLFGPKISFFNNIPNGWFGGLNERSRISDHNGTKFFEIGQKLLRYDILKYIF